MSINIAQIIARSTAMIWGLRQIVKAAPKEFSLLAVLIFIQGAITGTTLFIIQQTVDGLIAFHNEICAHFQSPSFVCLNSLMSSMASYEIIKFFLKFGECITQNTIVCMNPLNFEISKIAIPKNPLCSICSSC